MVVCNNETKEFIVSLYHKEIGFPIDVKLPEGKFGLEWSEHALREADYDINGKIKPSNAIIIDPYRIFEIQVEQGKDIVKFCYRTRYNAKCDVVYALIPNGNGAFTVKTAWLNRRSDKHATLNYEKYDKPV